MAFCPTCGVNLPASANFCPSCGDALDTHVIPTANPAVATARRAATRTQTLSPRRAPRVRYPALDELAPFPTFGQRVGAWLIDLCIIGVFAWIAALGFAQRAAYNADQSVSSAYREGWSFGNWFGLVFVGIAVCYLPMCEGSRSGQTAGKHALGMRVVRAENGEPLGFALGFGRFFARVADLYSIGLLWAAFDPYGRAFHDHLAGTVVIEARLVREKRDQAPTGNFDYRRQLGP